MAHLHQHWIDDLVDLPALGGIPTKRLHWLSRLMTRIDRQPGRVLMAENDPGNEVFLLLRGDVAVCIGEQLVATRTMGDFIGEIALLEHRPRTATVLTTSAVTLGVFNRREFMTLLAASPELSELVRSTAARRLADLEDVRCDQTHSRRPRCVDPAANVRNVASSTWARDAAGRAIAPSLPETDR